MGTVAAPQQSATLTRWGNGQGVLVPKALCKMLGWNVGDKLELVPKQDGELSVRATRHAHHRTRRVSAAELFAQYEGTYEPPEDWPTTGNEIDWGEPVGREVW